MSLIASSDCVEYDHASPTNTPSTLIASTLPESPTSDQARNDGEPRVNETEAPWRPHE